MIRRSSSVRSAGSPTGLARWPSMPASRQCSTSSAAVSAVSARIGISGRSARIARAASSPPITGMRRSSRTASKLSRRGRLDRGLAVLDQHRLDAEPLELHADQAPQRRRRPRRPARGSRSARARPRSPSPASPRRSQRQLERERRALAERAHHGHVAAHGARQPARDD